MKMHSSDTDLDLKKKERKTVCWIELSVSMIVITLLHSHFFCRYDTEGIGVINGEKLMNKLGISLRSGFTPAPVAEYGRRSVSPPNSPTQISRKYSSIVISIFHPMISITKLFL